MAKMGTASRPLPPLILGQPPAKWTIPLLRYFLALFKKKLIPRQHRTTMLVRLADLEDDTPLLKQCAIAQLQCRGAPLTRKAIDAWTNEESQEEQPDKDEPDRTCEACLDDLPASSYRRIKLAPDCDHNCSTCELCLRQAIDAQLSDEEADWGTLHCPTCRSVLLPETVRKYSPEGILPDYNELQVSFHMRNMRNFCWCENPSCHSGQSHLPGKDNPKMTCIKCGFDTCFTHHVKWHEGRREGQHNAATCSDFHGESLAAIKNTTKACPNRGVRVKKDEDCDHMICTICGDGFS